MRPDRAQLTRVRLGRKLEKAAARVAGWPDSFPDTPLAAEKKAGMGRQMTYYSKWGDGDPGRIGAEPKRGSWCGDLRVTCTANRLGSNRDRF